MSLFDFLKSDLIGNQNLKLTGKDNAISGTYEYADEEFVVLRGKDGNLHGMRASLVEMIHTDESSDQRGFSQSSGEYAGDGAVRSGADDRTQSDATSREGKKSYTPAPFKEFKPGDKMPLEELTSRDPRVASGWKRKEKSQYVNNALSQRVSEAIEEIRQAERPEDDYNLVAFGKIIELQPGFLFGFIDDYKEGARYYFNKNDLIDPSLVGISGKDIPVIYYRTQNHKGKAAKSIILPHSVRDTLELAAKLIPAGELYSAKHIISNVLEVYPENSSALRLKDTYARKEGTGGEEGEWEHFDREEAEMYQFYKEGKRMLLQKDYRGAIQSFQTALDNDFKPESCIKEIASAYIGLHSKAEDKSEKEKISKEGIAFINEYRPKLPDRLSTLFTLENVYFALGDYKEHIEVVEEIIAECGRNNDIPQYAFYLNKAAQSYMRLGEYNKALDAVLDGLESSPTHPQLQRTQFVLMEEMNARGEGSAEAETEESGEISDEEPDESDQ